MSWSVYSKGKPSAVKKDCEIKFKSCIENTASVPAESTAVKQALELTNGLLDVLIASDYPFVDVKGWGSGSNDNQPNWKGNVSFNLTVTPLQSLE